LVHTTVRVEWEARYVSQYLADKYPTAIVMHRVPMGDIPEELKQAVGAIAATQWFRPSRPVADAIAITPTHLVLIEGKIFDPNRAIGQLLFYSRLIDFTPELAPYKDLPRIYQVVTAREPPWASHAQEFTDVQIIVYAPDWIQDYYEHLQGYWTKTTRAARETRKQTLTALGFTSGAQ